MIFGILQVMGIFFLSWFGFVNIARIISKLPVVTGNFIVVSVSIVLIIIRYIQF